MMKELGKGIWILFILGLIIAAASVSSIPEGPTNINKVTSERRPVQEASSVKAVAGNITSLNIIGTTTTSTWQGYFGNVSATIKLEDAKNNTLYSWELASPEGEIYASTSAIDFSNGNIECFNFSANLAALEASLGLEWDDVDGVNETFSSGLTHQSFYSGTNFIDGSSSDTSCPLVKLFNSTEQPASGLFEEVLLYDKTSSKVIYTSIIEEDAIGFTNSTMDFQMIVGENGHDGDEDVTTYFFYAELE